MANNSGEFGLKKLAEQIFGTKVVEILKTKRMTYRDIWELSNPTTQCGNIIGSSVDGVSECWLCGFLINSKIPALSPECEHVLPVGQALLFLDLYKHSVHKGTLSKDLETMLKLEYRWAHSLCNRTKSDINFLGFDDKGQPVILDVVIRKYLRDLYDNKSDDIKKMVGRGKSVDDWTKARIADIHKQLHDIITHINKKTTGLLLLSGVASLFEPENIATSLRDIITPEKVEVVPNVDTLTAAFDENELKKLVYFIEYKSNLTHQISHVVKQLSLTIGTKLEKRDTDSKFILALRDKYNLRRTAGYDEAVSEELLTIVKENLIVPFERVMETDIFRGLYLTYSAYKTGVKNTLDLFNPFMLELIYMCLLCILDNQISRNSKLNGALDIDIEAIQRIWIAKCEEDYYKLFFCRMTELYINEGVISKSIIKCVIRVSCSNTDTKLANVAKLDFSKKPVVPVAPKVSSAAAAAAAKGSNAAASAPVSKNAAASAPVSKNTNLVTKSTNAPNKNTNLTNKSTNSASKSGPSCPVCPSQQTCPAVPNCPQATKTEKTLLQQLLDEVNKERASPSMFGGKRKNVKYLF